MFSQLKLCFGEVSYCDRVHLIRFSDNHLRISDPSVFGPPAPFSFRAQQHHQGLGCYGAFEGRVLQRTCPRTAH